ncbi:MAG: molybdopterin-binding protein [Nitrososphaerota archaeon]|nr:molybdopterin-binding protein [Candidatus Bathyarchaeota archaeon]MCX8161702.1 molybdopterin-binding protein [Candidatus Bathyarchaeota archaeon]MDW8062114.1 molybdopterin-binding protein [Nitrososphaerota archaeon]
MFTVEILSIGNELLIGKIANTNAQYLARRITELGGKVTRIIVVGDDLDEIASAIRESLRRSPSFIITTGGLGPTFDDMTLAGIGKALGLDIVLNEEALRMIRERYEALSKERGTIFELTPARVKMAMLPKNAEPIRNPTGTAPAVRLKADSTVIYALPGVPSEMKAIFEEYIAPVFAKISDRVFLERYLFIEGMPESSLAPILEETMAAYSCIYLKSHPRMEEGRSHIELHITIYSESKEKAESILSSAVEYLKKAVEKKGGVVFE